MLPTKATALQPALNRNHDVPSEENETQAIQKKTVKPEQQAKVAAYERSPPTWGQKDQTVGLDLTVGSNEPSTVEGTAQLDEVGEAIQSKAPIMEYLIELGDGRTIKLLEMVEGNTVRLFTPDGDFNDLRELLGRMPMPTDKFDVDLVSVSKSEYQRLKDRAIGGLSMELGVDQDGKVTGRLGRAFGELSGAGAPGVPGGASDSGNGVMIWAPDPHLADIGAWDIIKNGGGGALAGAELGAKVGTLLGPQGTVGGAVLGGFVGFVAGVTIAVLEDRAEEEEAQCPDEGKGTDRTDGTDDTDETDGTDGAAGSDETDSTSETEDAGDTEGDNGTSQTNATPMPDEAGGSSGGSGELPPEPADSDPVDPEDVRGGDPLGLGGSINPDKSDQITTPNPLDVGFGGDRVSGDIDDGRGHYTDPPDMVSGGRW